MSEENGEAQQPAQQSDAARTNVYEGQADARQLAADAIPDDCRLFRKRYRALSPQEIALHDAIKDKADELAALIAQIDTVCPELPNFEPGSAQYKLAHMASNATAHEILALRHLEDCVYRAVKALTA